ncbi:MAG: hypothetical protein AAGE96_03635 [Cyanobacteria bacterium P01_G01_bin.19]
MKVDKLDLSHKIAAKFQQLKQEQNFVDIAKLITYSIRVNSQPANQQIFGYIPRIFRVVEIADQPDLIQSKDIFIDEPVVYQVNYSGDRQMYGLKYFYIFCYLKARTNHLNVHFQSAHPKYKDLCPEHYTLEQEKISFEGCLSSFIDPDSSVISISDPGHFLPDMTSSYYVGSTELNFPKLIASLVEKIALLAEIDLGQSLFFGSSAGTFGALLSSTYLSKKTNVLAVNSQINVRYRRDIMQACFGISNPKEVGHKFGSQVSCIHRFKQELTSVPNIYILANINDNLHQRNFNFYQHYMKKYTQPGVNHQSVFDSYYGVDGHGRPEASSLKAKIKIARAVLTMKST